eukprot:1933117-Amphidinium_carterae.1
MRRCVAHQSAGRNANSWGVASKSFKTRVSSLFGEDIQFVSRMAAAMHTQCHRGQEQCIRSSLRLVEDFCFRKLSHASLFFCCWHAWARRKAVRAIYIATATSRAWSGACQSADKEAHHVCFSFPYRTHVSSMAPHTQINENQTIGEQTANN